MRNVLRRLNAKNNGVSSISVPLGGESGPSFSA
jgi:hypothetical protein